MAKYTWHLGRYTTDDGFNLAFRVRSDQVGIASVTGYTAADGTESRPGDWATFKPRTARVISASGTLHSIVCFTNTASLYATPGTNTTIQEGGSGVGANRVGHEGERVRLKKAPAYAAP